MKSILLVLTLSIVLISNTQASDLIIDNVWIRAMPPTSRVIPVYFHLHNQGDHPVSLVAIHCERGSVDLHQTIMNHARTHMTPVTRIEIQSGETVKLEPAGLHGMMSALTQGVPKADEKISLVLVFASGATKQVIATVRK